MFGLGADGDLGHPQAQQQEQHQGAESCSGWGHVSWGNSQNRGLGPWGQRAGRV